MHTQGNEISLGTTSRLNASLERLVPGGAHTYAKGADQFPLGLAPLIEAGSGSRVRDVDGNEYIEYGSGLRAVSLGHANTEVNQAAKAAMDQGINFVRPSRAELTAAEQLLAVVPNAEMVKFAKNGSDVTTAAVKLARAWTGRDMVVGCGGFLSVDDWYIGSTSLPGGIPDAIRRLTLAFDFNRLDQLERIFAENGQDIACVVLEGEREVAPEPGFLEGVRSLCHAHGALFVLDEMVAGFRLAMAGVQELHSVEPDLATFGKALANGFALSALVGKREIMDIGSLQERERHGMFLLSTTHGAEVHALAAMGAVIEIYQRDGIIDQLYASGRRLRQGLDAAILDADVSGFVEIRGREPNLVFATRDPDRQPSQAFRTLFMQELIVRGVLAPSFVVGAAHTEADIDHTIEAAREALTVYAKALSDGPDAYLRGRPVRPVFPSH